MVLVFLCLFMSRFGERDKKLEHVLFSPQNLTWEMCVAFVLYIDIMSLGKLNILQIDE